MTTETMSIGQLKELARLSEVSGRAHEDLHAWLTMERVTALIECLELMDNVLVTPQVEWLHKRKAAMRPLEELFSDE